MSKYEVVRLDESNLHLLDTLYLDVYKKRVPRVYFRKKYDTGFTGARHIGYFACDGKRPVAFYGVVPVLMSMSGKTVLAAQSCDTMTAPDHRNRGLFTELAEKTFALAAAEGITFVFGFPNEASYPGFIGKLRFDHLHTMNRYVFHFGDTLYKKTIGRLANLPAAAPGAIQNSLLNEGWDGVYYNQKYLKYKQFSGGRAVSVKGRSAWLKYRRHVIIGAFWPNERGNETVFLSELARCSNAVTLTAMVSPDTEADSRFSGIQQAAPGFPVIVRALDPRANYTRLKFQYADIDIF
jgi:hypothetical protein